MPSYVLSPAPQASLINIKYYSTKALGKKRTTTYLKKLRFRMKELSRTPLTSLARDEIKKGYFSYYEGSHTIYYRIIKAGIENIDILHQSMESSFHL